MLSKKLISLKIIKIFLSILLFCSCNKKTNNSLSLEGEWKVKIDSLNNGEQQKWYLSNFKGNTIELPGTLDENGIGKHNYLKPKMNDTILFSLSRKTHYTGKAWYQKKINLSENWSNESVILSLERVIWQSKVWVNGKFVGSAESLSVPHRFKLEDVLVTGENTITIQIDNSYIHKDISFEHERYPTLESQGFSHAYTNQTQGKWNGIIGEISLKKISKNAINYTCIVTDFKNKRINGKGFFNSNQNKQIAINYSVKQNGLTLKKGKFSSNNKGKEFNFSIDLPRNLLNWDEHNKNLYSLELSNQENEFLYSTPFGITTIDDDNGDLILNGKPIYLRGTLESAVFPIKGRPEMNYAEWLKILKILKSYGFNHIRFHSWCPPEAAFSVADKLGIYLQPELPHWSLNVGENLETNAFLEHELELILQEYGNHPSFVLMSMGNELEGDFNWLNKLTKKAKKLHPSKLYTTSTFSFQKGVGTKPQPEDDFLITQWTDKGWVRGQGFFNTVYPRFDVDYRTRINHIKKPIIAHEIGQYAVYPNLDEIEKYTGVMQPLNFKAIKIDLQEKGLLHLAPDFTLSSGKLASLLYKEDIERNLKTKGYDGFQMLQIQDYPGHGTALVGLLDVFWESKGIIDSLNFKKFNNDIVPLLRFEKAVFKSGESFKAKVQIANFKQDLENTSIEWQLTDEKKVIDKGLLESRNIKLGNNNFVGEINIPLKTNKAKKLKISIKLANYSYTNDWDLWIYPKIKLPESEVIFTKSFKEAKQLLQQGKKVLLNPTLSDDFGLKNRFGPIFWSQLMFEQPPNMGLLCDPKHAAFSNFPTDPWTNWQWWDLTTNSKSLDLSHLKIEPIIRVIDDFTTNRSLGLAFETKVGKGSLLFTSIDLSTNIEKRIEAKQLKYSFLNYMNSKDFNPKKNLSFKQIESLKKNKSE